MNINCSICSDLFNPTAVIYVTRCGHAFHYTCLVQWIERSKTCPQCRSKVSDKNIFRIFFNIVTLEGAQDDPVTLQSKLDAANLQLRLKENHCKSIEEKIEIITNEKFMLEESSKNFKKEYETMRSGFISLKEKINFYKERAKLVDKVESEISQLKEAIQNKEQAMKAITGSVDEANEIINLNADPKTLAIIAASLKKEIQAIEKKKNKYFISMKRVENELTLYKRELEASKSECDKLKRDLSAHNHCEEQIQTLKTKISDIAENNKIIDRSLERVVAESPAPLRKRNIEDNSPSLIDRVKAIKDSDSPYLQIKSNSMGLLFKSQESSPKTETGKLSIFKSSSLSDVKIRKPLLDYEYDGFGGHKKDDRFPIPTQKTGIKRTKSSNMSSRKFKKLAKPVKKIDDFLNISNVE